MNGEFRNVDWGSDEAKGDENLAMYFVDPPDYQEIFQGKKRYVIGRKGTGKSAVVQRLKLLTEDSALDFTANLSLREFPMNDMRDISNKSQRDKSRYTPIWQFLIYTEIAKMIAADNGAAPLWAADELRSFLSSNNLDSDIGFSNTVSLLKSKSSKLKIAANWLEAEHQEGGQKTTTMDVHYQKVAKALENKIKSITSDSTYWIFIDELDEGYKSADQSLRLLLLALVRAVEETAISLKKANFSFRPMLVLRSDIFDRLEDNDLNKIDDFIIRLRWTSAEDHVENSLKRIVTERIRSSIGNSNDPWGEIALDQDPELPSTVDSLWQYIANRTYERPRDVIKFMKCCTKQIPSGQKLTFKHVRDAENDYSNWLYREIKDEISSHLSCWKEALDCITRIGTWKISTSDLKDELSRDTEIKKWVETNSSSYSYVIEKLYDFGVIGNAEDNNRWLFKYKDEDLSWNPNMDNIVHFGLNKKLKLKRRKRASTALR